MPYTPQPRRVSYHPGVDVVPLSFETNFPGYQLVSWFPGHNLPVELLPHIIRHLTPCDLRALSLVDSDCRKISAPVLFRGLTIQTVEQLQQVVCSETLAPIARFVRFLDIKLQEIGASVSIQHLLRILPSKFPNLIGIQCDSTIINANPLTPQPHPRLANLRLLNHCGFTHPFPQNLQTLHLDVERNDEDPMSASDLINQALDQSHTTLRQFILTGRPLLLDFGPSSISAFPCLRHVVLGESASASTNLLRALLGSNTKVQSLALFVSHSHTLDFLRARGYITTLNEFTLMGFNFSLPFEHLADFLLDNCHIQTFHSASAFPPHFVTSTLMPVIEKMYQLASLRMVIDIPDEDEETAFLDAISTLTELRELWLSAGNQELAGNRWMVDHDKLLKALQPLSSLRQFALSKDGYHVSAHPLAPRYGDYYTSRTLPMSVNIEKYLTPEERKICDAVDPHFEGALTWRYRMSQRAWERWHVERMSNFACKYATAFPNLTWCYLGQLPFSVRVDGMVPRVIQPDYESRDVEGEVLARRLSRCIWRPV